MDFVKGRFAPSPSGRMHLGNLYTALISWLSARKAGGSWLLRIEDLDPQRSKPHFARAIEEDLLWLGLEWDEGGLAGHGPNGPYLQSLRNDIYAHYLAILRDKGLTYPCTCSRADIIASRAPHQSDGQIVYSGHCRPANFPGVYTQPSGPHSVRLYVPDKKVYITDRLAGPVEANLAKDIGDFVLRRSDGGWAYQLAVVVDDALMGVTEVVRGNDLLLSAVQQSYLYDLFGFKVPEFAHLPLLCSSDGHRLSKRDESLSAEYLRTYKSPEEVCGTIAAMAGIIPDYEPISANRLIDLFDWEKLRHKAASYSKYIV